MAVEWTKVRELPTPPNEPVLDDDFLGFLDVYYVRTPQGFFMTFNPWATTPDWITIVDTDLRRSVTRDRLAR